MILINIFESTFAVVFFTAVITSLFTIPEQLSTKKNVINKSGEKGFYKRRKMGKESPKLIIWADDYRIVSVLSSFNF